MADIVQSQNPSKRKTVDSEIGLSLETLRQCLRYEPETGDFYWLARSSFGSHVEVGSKAGSIHKRGYWQISICGYQYKAHRLAWFYMTGEWPVSQVDHKDLCKCNNRWSNLRLATNQENMRNRSLYTSSTTGFKGVHFRASIKKFQAQIGVDGRNRYLGSFDTAEQAHAAYVKAAQQFFGEFARVK
jgi:hypothetical protein